MRDIQTTTPLNMGIFLHIDLVKSILSLLQRKSFPASYFIIKDINISLMTDQGIDLKR